MKLEYSGFIHWLVIIGKINTGYILKRRCRLIATFVEWKYYVFIYMRGVIPIVLGITG
jgi:hypothetical protein